MLLVRHSQKSRTGHFRSICEAMREINPNYNRPSAWRRPVEQSWRASTPPFSLQNDAPFSSRRLCESNIGKRASGCVPRRLFEERIYSSVFEFERISAAKDPNSDRPAFWHGPVTKEAAPLDRAGRAS
jgi:hypothetical protein